MDIGVEPPVRRTLPDAARVARVPTLQRCDDGGCGCGRGGPCDSRRPAAPRRSRPGDAAEVEADLLGRLLARSVAARSTAYLAAEGSLAVAQRVSAGVDRVAGRGEPLAAATRVKRERAFGADLDEVRVHRGREAAARAADAEALTAGSDVFTGGGRADTGRDRDGVLSHKLTHVVQVRGGLHRRTLFRATADDCCSSDGCLVPDTRAAWDDPLRGWFLTIAVDREEEGLGRLKSGNVGHTWVKFEDSNRETWSFGHWPRDGFNAKRPFANIPGCIHHPDVSHEPPNAVEFRAIQYALSKEAYGRALAFAQSECQRPPTYNLFKANCTSFATATARVAGVTPPASTTLTVPNPNALFEGMEKDLKDPRKTRLRGVEAP